MEGEHDCCKNKSGGRGFKSYLLVGMVALVLLVSVFQSFQISSIKGNAVKNQVTGNAVGGIDMNGWTDDEKMQYEHHGIMPARLQQTKQTSQVGSC